MAGILGRAGPVLPFSVAIDLPALLIGQYQNSPKLRAIVTDIIAGDRDTALAALTELRRMLNISTAEGVWLDILAARLGLTRPATTDPAVDQRFGFDDAGVGFDTAPFRGDTANDAVYPLPDPVFRRFVRARAVLVFGDGTFGTYRRAVKTIDAGATVTDLRNMTVRITTSDQPMLQLADTSGALPRTAGVAVLYRDRERFGFDDAGQPFDQGAFTAA